MTMQELMRFKYPNRSTPEFLWGTLLARDEREILIGCEGVDIPFNSDNFVGYDHCGRCEIVERCYLRLNEIMMGGKVR